MRDERLNQQQTATEDVEGQGFIGHNKPESAPDAEDTAGQGYIRTRKPEGAPDAEDTAG